MALAGDFPLLHRLEDGAALLAGVGAGGELALAQIGQKLPEAVGQLLLVRQAVALDVKGGEAGGKAGI